MICGLRGFTASGVSFCAVVSLLTFTTIAGPLLDALDRAGGVRMRESVIRSLEQAVAAVAANSAAAIRNDSRCMRRFSGGGFGRLTYRRKTFVARTTIVEERFSRS